MSILKRGTKIYSIVNLKCPRCQEGNLFSVSNAWNVNKMLAMPERCSICNQDFMIEPGFYYGALWVSYPIVVVATLMSLSMFLIFPDSYVLNFSIMAIILFSLQPLIMRWGRAAWINIFVRYEPNWREEKPK